MAILRSMTALTLVNLAVLAATVAMRSASADGTPLVLRGRGLEIVDELGRVRASISILPAGMSEKGDRYRETVLLRLITERGRPSVKIGASEESAGLNLSGPTGTKDTYLILEAKDTATYLKLRNENGREQVLKP
jgi:hypothetical protein